MFHTKYKVYCETKREWMNDIQNALEEYCERHVEWITQRLPKDVNTLNMSEMRAK